MSQIELIKLHNHLIRLFKHVIVDYILDDDDDSFIDNDTNDYYGVRDIRVVKISIFEFMR